MPLTTKNGKLPVIVTDLEQLKMKKLTLKTFSTDDVTIGKLYNGNNLICYTVERPWLDNVANESCIPEGEYTVKMTNSPRFGPTYEVKNVPGRTHILFHKGNTVKDSLGCILPVSNITVFDGRIGGASSKFAYDRLMNLLHAETFILKIERTL